MLTALTPTGRWETVCLRIWPDTDRTARRRPLAGRRIAISNTPRLASLASLLAERGATLLRYAAPAGSPAANPSVARSWVTDLLERRVHDVIWTSAEGVRQVMRFAAEEGVDCRLALALRRVRIFSVGVATARALQALGVPPQIATASEAPRDLMKALRKHNLVGRRIALQLGAAAESKDLETFLQWMRADARVLALPGSHVPRIRRDVALLVKTIATAQLDALIFADAAEAKRLLVAAAALGLARELSAGLARTHIVATSRRVASEIEPLRIHADIVPPQAMFPGVAVDALVHALLADERAATAAQAS